MEHIKLFKCLYVPSTCLIIMSELIGMETF